MADTNFSEADIQAFSEKLHAWGGTLEEGERALLRALLVSAESNSEVEGFGVRSIPGDTFLGGAGGGALPSISKQSFSILQPLALGDNPWVNRAYPDTWKPTK